MSSVEAVLFRQRDLSESSKDNIRSRIASTVQSASIPDSNLTKDEQQALKRLKTDNNIFILPAEKGHVTVAIDKTDYFDKLDALVNDKQTYEELKRDPTPALQRKLNSKILTLKKNDAIETQRYYRLRCSVLQGFLSKRQSPTTVLFRTTLTRTITLYELLILLGSNHY